jgi:hypothetical protein
LTVLIVLVVLIIAATAGGSSHPRVRRSGVRRSAHRAAVSAKPTRAATATQTNPLTTTAIQRLLAARDGQKSIAVEDLKTGREWVLNPGARDQTASIVKADILETLLYQAQQRGTPVADAESETAEEMIEESDNDDASALWDQIGAAPGLDAYNTKAGLDQTSGAAGGYWGETLTSAADQIRLLRQLSVPHGLLSSAAVQYELGLMENIAPGENWGVTGGVPSSGVTVALKNGWVPLTSGTDWEVNSIGWVRGDGHDYLIAVLTAHDSSEDDGIDTIDAVSKLIYDTLGPAPPAGTPTITVTPDG